MKVGIIGLAGAGKTSVFNALTGLSAEVHSYSGAQGGDANVGIVTVPDERIDWLTELAKPKKTTLATIEVVDVSGMVPGTAQKGGFSAEFLAHLRQVDALVLVVRSFEDESVPHPDGSVNPLRDVELVELELIMADLSVVEKRLEKLGQEIQRKKGAERSQVEAEEAVLKVIRESLSSETPIRQIELSEEDRKSIRGYTFLSQKPLLIVANIGEAQIGKGVIESSGSLKDFAVSKGAPLLAFCAKTEMEIAQLAEAERGEFLAAMGIDESGRDKLIKESYKVLKLIPFFTFGEDEVRAWTITEGTIAQEAARKIHSDIARGFIRAQVVAFDALKEHGNMVKAKDKGLVRLEGKEYVVQNGDIIEFRFAV